MRGFNSYVIKSSLVVFRYVIRQKQSVETVGALSVLNRGFLRSYSYLQAARVRTSLLCVARDCEQSNRATRCVTVCVTVCDSVFDGVWQCV